MDRIEQFAALHSGGFVADVSEGVKPLLTNGETAIASGEEYEALIEQHLYGEEALGVYPLMERNGLFWVNWVAVDLDEGDISEPHADNLVALLEKLSIRSWKEPSRSKGFHVWVYLERPLQAAMARNCMIGACRLIETPIKEVYPKQVKLGPGKIGNCLRLPYAATRNTGRQQMRDLTWEEFTDTAWATRCAPEHFERLHALYLQTEPAKAAFSYSGTNDSEDFTGRARTIWENPFEKDRSSTLYRFAASLLERDYSVEATIYWVTQLDERVGKFKDREDGPLQIERMVESALRSL